MAVPRHAGDGFGSSLLDMAVAQEQQSGRQVFMDFNRNPEAVPGDLPFSLDRLDDDVRAYLENNDALAPSPIERLQRMNPLSSRCIRCTVTISPHSLCSLP